MVSSLNVSVLFWVLLVCLAWIEVHLGCIQEERIGLLKLKEAFINYPNPYEVLPSWGNEEETDCCKWKRVECDPITKRILQLYLNSTTENLYLNLSLFHPFQELQNLDLSWNFFEGFHGVLTLKKLRKLDLSVNDLTEIPSMGGALHSLKYLDLRVNELSNTSSLGALYSLKYLGLGWNELGSTFNFQGLSRLKNLEELDLSGNGFSGAINSCLNNLTSLKLLDLSHNNFVGTIPSTLFLNLKALEYVSLSHNNFEGSFSLTTSFANNSKLEVFQLHSNSINRLKVYIENSNWTPPFQLKFLRISNCELNDLNFLVNQHDLRVVVLSHNGMVGKFPNWLILNNTNLEVASLHDNLFTGSFSLHPDTRYLDMAWLDISANQIHGELPNFIGSILPNLIFLNMSVNQFQGLIPPSVGDMTELESLDLSDNNLSGEIPQLLVMGCTSLLLLKLSNNNLQGSLFPVKSNLSNLKSLSLNNNSFSGELLPGLLNSTYLELLDFSDNTISGEIPDWFGKFSRLHSLALSRNSFEGHIPTSFCALQELSFLDLSHNRFHGIIPSCANLSSLIYLHLQRNKFIGPLPYNLTRSSFLVTLDLRDNKFSGNVPNWISSFHRLRFLLLKENNFNGSIPLQICWLENINILDMSFNNFSGLIPTCLCRISFGAEKLSDYDFQERKHRVKVNEFDMKYYSYSNELKVTPDTGFNLYESHVDEEIEFMSKRRSESYIGNPLDHMSGLDLSSNKLTGLIPNDLGNLTNIHTLNLSHNQLSSFIPSTLSKLKQIQSLDLSYNKLSGRIPSELTELNFLSTFSAAYNNLSGRLPDMRAQFGTFDERSYEGNPLLCGPPLKKSCNSNNNGQPPSIVNLGEDSDTFMDAFLLSFLGSFAAAFLAVISFLCISAYYKKRLFAFIEAKIGVCQCILLKLIAICKIINGYISHLY